MGRSLAAAARSIPLATPSATAAGTLVVDVVTVVGVLSVGMTFHGGQPLETPWRTLGIVVPFLVGWAIGATALGVYRRPLDEAVGQTMARVAGAWFLAAVVGGLLRSTEAFPGDAPPIFVAVTFGSGALGLLGWRLGYRLLRTVLVADA